MSATCVPLLELFSSFQGEGPRVGERQIFVRLSGCDLRCAYCDTPESFGPCPHARVERRADAAGDEHPENPVPTSDIVRWIERLDAPRGLHQAVSITGGEPLLHAKAVREIAEGVRKLGLRVHLETGGHRPDALAQILDVVDEVTPDLKLQSATLEPTRWDGHERTLAILHEASKALAVKAVVASGTSESEVDRAARFVQCHVPGVPFVLQPVTLHGEGPEPPSALHLRRLHLAARLAHPDVRVIPQTHNLLGVR